MHLVRLMGPSAFDPKSALMHYSRWPVRRVRRERKPQQTKQKWPRETLEAGRLDSFSRLTGRARGAEEWPSRGLNELTICP